MCRKNPSYSRAAQFPVLDPSCDIVYLCRTKAAIFLAFQQLLCVCVSAVVLNNLPSDGVNKSSDRGADGNASGAEEQRLPEGELLLQVGGIQAVSAIASSVRFPALYPASRSQLGHKQLTEAWPLSTAGQHLSDQHRSGD